MKILDGFGRKFVIVDDTNFGKTMGKISKCLDYIDPTHRENEEEIVGIFRQIKEYGITENGLGTPYRFSDAKQSIVYVTEQKNKVMIDMTKLIKVNPEFSERFETKNNEISK